MSSLNLHNKAQPQSYQKLLEQFSKEINMQSYC